MMAFVRQVLVIMAKDLRAELRTKEAINASLSFALVVLLLFSFAFDPSEETTRQISGGLLWIVFAFAGTLLLNRSFARELENDCLDALISAPISGAALFLGKALANYVLVMAVELIALPPVRDLLQCPLDFPVLAIDDGGGAGHLGNDRDGHDFQRTDGQHPATGSDAADSEFSDFDTCAAGGDAIDQRAGGGEPHHGGQQRVAEDAYRLRRHVHRGFGGPCRDGIGRRINFAR